MGHVLTRGLHRGAAQRLDAHPGRRDVRGAFSASPRSTARRRATRPTRGRTAARHELAAVRAGLRRLHRARCCRTRSRGSSTRRQQLLRRPDPDPADGADGDGTACSRRRDPSRGPRRGRGDAGGGEEPGARSRSRWCLRPLPRGAGAARTTRSGCCRTASQRRSRRPEARRAPARSSGPSRSSRGSSPCSSRGVPAGPARPPAGTAWSTRPPSVPIGVSPADIEGSEADRTGYQGLAIAKDVTMVAIPDLATIARRADGTLDEDTYLSVQGKLVDWCQIRGTRMAILDAPPGLNASRALEWRTRLARDTAFGALYYPNLVVDNPLAQPGSTNGTSSSRSAGRPRRWRLGADGRRPRGLEGAGERDRARHRPAGERLHDRRAGPAEPQGDQLHPLVRSNGMRIWGARTLAMSDPSWRYVPVRRLFIFSRSRSGGARSGRCSSRTTRPVGLVGASSRCSCAASGGRARCRRTAEPGLLRQVRRRTTRRGRRRGPADREVGIAPVKPAEFVIFRISQWQSGGPSVERWH